jgi:microcystin-dependent protein
MSEPFLAEIVMFGANFAPRGWAYCEGQLLPINQNSALFSLLGTIYGGDGRTTFALPDLRGRVPIQPGNGPGLSSYTLGERGGAERVTLTIAEMPSHNHSVTLHGERGASTSTNPAGNLLANGNSYAAHNSANPEPAMASQSITQANIGGGQSHYNIQPFLCVNFIIALQGTFPSRN